MGMYGFNVTWAHSTRKRVQRYNHSQAQKCFDLVMANVMRLLEK